MEKSANFKVLHFYLCINKMFFLEIMTIFDSGDIIVLDGVFFLYEKEMF